MNATHKSLLSLIASIISLVLIGFIIGLSTKGGVDTWYATLHRSPLTPPNYVFGIAWSILYAMIATAGWFIWRAQPCPELPTIKKLFIAQLMLNWCWTPLFFTYHLIGSALACIMLIITLVALLIITSYSKMPLAALLLMPYLLWLLFAAHLNFHIWLYD
ncbi:MAG: tryptophan-rich sensory protein [Epsilonproteobacteria bacterium]|nr:tryptophan-rich sensory protein [Campylobacterota bacterium]